MTLSKVLFTILFSFLIGNSFAQKTKQELLKLIGQKDLYKANQVQIQIKTSEAWILFKKGKNDDAIKLMIEAADMEDATEKHPVTPGEVIPARELLGDMLFEMNKPAAALEAYEADLKKHAKRFNGLYGAAISAEKSNDLTKAIDYYQQVVDVTNGTGSNRAELEKAKLFLKIKIKKS